MDLSFFETLELANAAERDELSTGLLYWDGRCETLASALGAVACRRNRGAGRLGARNEPHFCHYVEFH
jgi:hypothetical protein